MPTELLERTSTATNARRPAPGNSPGLNLESNLSEPISHHAVPVMKKRRRPTFWVTVVLATFATTASAIATLTHNASKATLGPLLTHTVSRGDLKVSTIEKGTLASAENTEIKCQVRGDNTVIWVVENGTIVKEGDVIVRLDTLQIEDQINERSKNALASLAGAEQARANAKRAALAIKEYEEGRYVVQLKTLEKDLAIAESNLRTNQNILQHAQQMFERGYVRPLEIQEKTFAVTQAELIVEGKKTEIEVLDAFTKKQQLEQLNGDLKSAEASRDSLNERARMDGIRRELAMAELELCTIRAPKSGMVIYPSAQAWDSTPDIEEGVTVYRGQKLLLMPDLENMEVKVGIHESIIERVTEGLNAIITLPDAELEGKVTTVATVAQPAGWWTGNLVKYDTTIGLPNVSGLRPGMSAEVEVILAEYHDVLSVPVSAVIETTNESLCWVQTQDNEIQKRTLRLGDNNEVFIVVEAGLEEGDRVVLNPRGAIEAARQLGFEDPTESLNEVSTGGAAGSDSHSHSTSKRSQKSLTKAPKLTQYSVSQK